MTRKQPFISAVMIGEEYMPYSEHTIQLGKTSPLVFFASGMEADCKHIK